MQTIKIDNIEYNLVPVEPTNEWYEPKNRYISRRIKINLRASVV